MAETPPPAPPYPRSHIRMDLVTKTLWGYRRNTFHFSTDTAPPGITELEACANRVKAVYAPLVTLLMSDDASIQRVEAKWFGPGTTGFEANSTTSPVAGVLVTPTPDTETTDIYTAVEDTLPDEVSLIVQKRTGNTNRGSFGRWFFCGLGEAVQNAGIVVPNYKGTAIGLANALSADITVSAGFATILHARHWNRADNAMQPITKCYAVGTMGSRRDRRRPLPLERL